MAHPTRLRGDKSKPAQHDAFEKDEVELRLEKAVFGDDAGFLESLQRHDSAANKALTRLDERESEPEDSEDIEDGDGGLSDVADEDVSLLNLFIYTH